MLAEIVIEMLAEHKQREHLQDAARRRRANDLPARAPARPMLGFRLRAVARGVAALAATWMR